MEKNNEEVLKPSIACGYSRRDFLQHSAVLGANVALFSRIARLQELLAAAEAGDPEALNPLLKAENQILTVCLQCNTGCGIKVKLLDGIAVKIEGNPYSPWTTVPSLPYATPVQEAATLEGALCPKGQAGIQTLYDPYRITKVLKRAGERGEGKWQAIPFSQAIQEIVNGGKLFSHVPGEEDRYVEGLKDLYALRDPQVATDMAKAIDAIRQRKTPEEKAAAVAEFKAKFAAHLEVLIDPDHPDFGPKNNQVTFMWGRLKGGRSEFIKRFISESYGSINAHGHTTVCQGSLYFTGKAMSDQYSDGKFTGGSKFYWQTDTAHVDYLLAIGTAYIEGAYGPTHHAKKLMRRLAEGKLELVVVDPRYSKIASKAHRWIPIRPGTEGAFALALIRWILEHQRFDRPFLSAANKAAAMAAGESSWTNATWLVKEDGTFLRASEVGLAPKEKRTTKEGKEYEHDGFVVMHNGQPVAFDPNDTKEAVVGDLLVDATVGDFKVKSVLQRIYEAASSHSLEEWAQICDVPVADLVQIAEDFSAHGKRAVADPHRGVSQHTNGFYNVLAVYTLNALVGNFDWKGGFIKATTYDATGEKAGQPFPLSSLHPRKLKPFGLSIIRHEAKYEESTIFAGYPAKRNWYPFASDVYEEILPSIADAYPYPTKILISYMAAAPYAWPGGQTNIEALVDLERLPLYIASDVTIGEMSMYADYIFPDLTYLERWEFHGSHPSIPQKVQPIRNPAVAPLPEPVQVFGEQMPICLESMLLAFAEQLGLPGFGKDAFGDGADLIKPEDLYLRMVANIAAGDQPGEEVPDADAAEMEVFLQSRRHLPRMVFDPERWQAVVGDRWWRKVVYVLNREGKFKDYAEAFEGEKFRNRYGKQINLYLEKYVRSKSPITGLPLPGIATCLPIANVVGEPIHDEAEGYDLHLITYREVTQTKSPTIVDYWLLAVQPENFILVNTADAQRLGLEDGDQVRVVSKSNPEGVWDLKNGRKKPMIGKVKVIQGIRPGVIAFSLGMGHWAMGSTDVVIDGQVLRGDPRRAAGIHANAAMRLDDYLKNTCLLDPIGGSVSFYDTKVKLVKV